MVEIPRWVGMVFFKKDCCRERREELELTEASGSEETQCTASVRVAVRFCLPLLVAFSPGLGSAFRLGIATTVACSGLVLGGLSLPYRRVPFQSDRCCWPG